MSILMTILGLLQIAAGIFFFGAAKGAVHETTAAIAIGMGVLAIGLGHVIHCLERHPEAEKKASPVDGIGSVLETYKQYDIRRAGLHVRAGGKLFDTVDEAKAHIDSL